MNQPDALPPVAFDVPQPGRPIVVRYADRRGLVALRAKVIGVPNAATGLITVEVLGGAMDGQVRACAGHDATFTYATAWCYACEWKGRIA